MSQLRSSENRPVVVAGASSGSGEGTVSLRTIGFSRGYYLTGSYIEGNQVPVVAVEGMELIKSSGVNSSVVKHLQTYSARDVISPFEFYLELKSDEGDLQKKKMQKHYEKEEMQVYKYLIQVEKTKCYAYRNSKKWCRVRVLDFVSDKVLNKRACVYHCDTGKQEYVLCEDLRQLEPEFREVWSPTTLKCYLYDVLPISRDMYWSVDAVAFFNKCISDRRLGAVVMKWSREPVVACSPDPMINCGVVLAEKLDPKNRPDTINWMMVKMGYARSIGIMSGSPRDLEIPGFVPSFAIPEEKENSKCVKGNEDKDRTAQDKLRSILAVAIGTSDAHVPTCYKRPTVPVNTPKNCLPYPFRCRLAWVRMSSVIGPSKIFVHIRGKKQELRAMEKELRKSFQSSMLPQPELESFSPGSLVAFKEDPPKGKSTYSYFRAVVLEVDICLNAARILKVDYGKVMKVRNPVLYQLPEKYRNIPSFVHRVHLSDIRPKEAFKKWNDFHNWCLEDYVNVYEKEVPLYYLHLPDNGDESMIKFMDFDQDLLFDDFEDKWMPADPEMDQLTENEVINSMRDDPLLASYFCTRPVNIFFEVRVREDDFWRFANLSDHLAKKRGVVLVKPGLDNDKVHEKIHEICKIGFGTL